MSKLFKNALIIYLSILAVAWILSNVVYWCIIISVLFLQTSNFVLRKWVDKRTMYKESIFNESEKLRLFYMYLGFPVTIFFPKQFRQIRKDAYYERRVKILEELSEYYKKNNVDLEEDLKDELIECNRYLKLKKIKHKQEVLWN